MPRNSLTQKLTLAEILNELRESHPEAALALAKQHLPQEDDDLPYTLHEATYAASLRQHLDEDAGEDRLTKDHVSRMAGVVAAWVNGHPTRMRSLLEYSDQAKTRAIKARRGPDLDEILGSAGTSSDTESGEKPRPAGRVKRQRRPITDPALLALRQVTLAKARAARAEKLAAARAET